MKFTAVLTVVLIAGLTLAAPVSSQIVEEDVLVNDAFLFFLVVGRNRAQVANQDNQNEENVVNLNGFAGQYQLDLVRHASTLDPTCVNPFPHLLTEVHTVILTGEAVQVTLDTGQLEGQVVELGAKFEAGGAAMIGPTLTHRHLVYTRTANPDQFEVVMPLVLLNAPLGCTISYVGQAVRI